MANMKMSNTIRDAWLQDIINLAGTGATLLLYDNSGPQPAGGASAGSSLLLGTMTIAGVFGTIVSHQLVLGTITQDSAADRSGTASWMRVMQGATWVCDLQVTATGGGGDVTMPSLSVTATLPIQMAGSQTITPPCAP